MHYIIFDLEWNQAQYCKRKVRNLLAKCPFRLTGEIIQIGAVRLNSDYVLDGDFKISIKPQFFSIIHQRVLKITGIDQAALELGVDFSTAMKHFKNWCGEGALFLSWGEEDLDILRQNLFLYQLDGGIFENFVDLQKIFGLEVCGDVKRQVSLKQAVEHFSLEQTRVAHDALNDAYYAAAVAQSLSLRSGIEKIKNELKEELFPDCASIRMEVIEKLKTKAEAFRGRKILRSRCPVCNAAMYSGQLIKKGKNEYYILQHCMKHGQYFVKISFERDYCYGMTARKRYYNPDKKRLEFYKQRTLKKDPDKLLQGETVEAEMISERVNQS